MAVISEKLILSTKQVAEQVGVDPLLLRAIVTTESSYNPMAVRYEPAFHYISNAIDHAHKNGITVETETILQKCSWGLGQIMGATARDLGYEGPIPKLCLPLTGLFWCAKYLKKLIERYPDNHAYISAYNAGSPSSKNQEYVQKVLGFMKSSV